MKKLLSIVVCVLLASSIAAAQEKPSGAAQEKPSGAAQEKPSTAAEKGLKVEKAVAALSVENREPTGESKEFDAAVGRVFCWSKISAETTPTTIKHVWYLGDQKVFEKALDVKYPSTRTWTSKAVTSGSWRVDVTDEAGTVLSSVSFTVK
jgi:DUF2914 family protein